MSEDLDGFTTRDETVPACRHRTLDMKPRFDHWREYAIEAACLALFMLSATGFSTLLQHPASPVSAALAAWPAGPAAHRVPMGLAMGLTAIALIYSPLGARSGAHMNPSLAQFAGGAIGIVAASLLLRGLPGDPSVNYAATVPGAGGAAAAFAAEAGISFLLMSVVLAVSNTPRLARYTGLFAGALVALYVVVEAPLSGMSMNPARTLGSNVLAHSTESLWIYFTAPPLGMLLAAETYARVRGRHRVSCAKLNHPATGRCIFCTETQA
jgi:aquaporin Z